MPSRQTLSLWFYLGFWKNYAGQGKNKWRFPEFVRGKFWRVKEFWIDTFGTPWNKYVACRVVGHGRTFRDEYGVAVCEKCFCYPIRDKIKRIALKDVPLYVNDPDPVVQEIVKTRLKMGR